MKKAAFISSLINWSRIKALAWHTGAIIAGYLVADLATAVSSHQVIVPAWAAIALGLVFAQVTKALNNYISRS